MSCEDKKMEKIIYADGSNNSYIITMGEKNQLKYNPMTAKMSSSGSYSGGDPKSINISSDELAKIKDLILKAVKNKDAHIKNRMMTSGQISIYNKEKVESYILAPSSKEKMEIEELLKKILKK